MKQVCAITGASAGLGWALSLEYARHGYHVVALARRSERLEELGATIGSELGHGSFTPHVCDVTDDQSVHQAFQEIARKFGQLDCLIVNAGFGVRGEIEALTIEDFQRQMDTNVFGAIRTIHGGLPFLKESKGKIGVIGSVLSYFSMPENGPYCMSKAAVRALAESLSFELRNEGVSVTLISPGLVATEIRKIDPQGNYRPDAKDPAPSFLMMAPEKAARKIYRAVEKRKQEKVLSFHGKLLVRLAGWCPRLMRVLASQMRG